MTSPTLNLRIACASLQDAWRRNLLALTGLAVGVGAVVAMLALTLIVRREALRQFDRSGLDVLALRQVSAPSAAGSARRPPAIDLELARRLAAAQPALELVAPVMQRRGAVAFDGRRAQAEVLGVTEEFFELNGLELAEGRGLTALDRGQPYAVLGRGQAAALRAAGDGAVVGRQLTVEGRVLTVVGVLAPARAIGLHAGDLDQAVLTDVVTCARAFGQAEIDVLYARHRAGGVTDEVARAAVDYLQAAVDGLVVQPTSAAALVAEMERQLRLFTLLLGATGSIALVLGAAGIMNSLLLAVAERRREIGLRRALGALRGDIQAQFLYEAVMLCAVGGLLGVILGAATTRIIAARAQWEFAVSPATLLLGFGVAVAVGAAAGFFPAHQAARLDPVVAMKSDH
ncbi:MAG: ABC transporter permease [Opitutaceae bacterium]|nr:ABC transporter permease [Opitutaceae bacterium]